MSDEIQTDKITIVAPDSDGRPIIIDWDMEAPFAKNGKCPYCDCIFFTGQPFNHKFPCPNVPCSKEICMQDAVIYNLISNPLMLKLTKILPIYGRQVSAEAVITVGLVTPIKLKKEYDLIKDIFITSYIEDTNISAEPTDIKPDSFKIISSSTNASDYGKTIRVNYLLNYIDKDSDYPLWLEYLYLATKMHNTSDYKTAIIMLVSVLDSYYDTVLREQINSYDLLAPELSIPAKIKTIKALFDIKKYPFSTDIQSLLELRNKLAHGYSGKISVESTTCDEYISLIVKVLYYHACKNYPSHPKDSLLSKTKSSWPIAEG